MVSHTANYVIDLIRLARDHEEAVQHLYEAFAEKIPENSAFWRGIASVEAQHVKLMETLLEHAKMNMLKMRPESVLTVKDLETTLAHLNLYIAEVRSRGISPKRAAVIAKEIEEGILESEFDRQFVAETEEGETILRRLCEETRGHSAAMDGLMVRKDEYTALFRKKIVSPVQVELARTIATKEGLTLDTVLIERFGVPRDALRASLAEHYRLEPFLPSETPLPPPEVLAPLQTRYEDMKARLYAPVALEGNRVIFALGNPSHLPLRDEIAGWYPKNVVSFRVGLSDDILRHIDLLFAGRIEVSKPSAAAIVDQLKREAAQEKIKTPETAEIVTEEDSALVKLVNLLIEEAYEKRASDIHIEPQPDDDTSVRIRVDGILQPLMRVPSRYSRAMIARIKIMAGLDITEHRLPQSGKIQYRRWGRLDLELRVETYPTSANQEDAVLRILASHQPLPLSQMEFSPRNEKKLIEAIEQPYGLFLCVGPTGSGKTTTLHSALAHINRPEKKILTIEDPIEITQKGLRQLQANPKAGLTFAAAMRSFLRADPDVIMVGEMRDPETAETAITASLTGHLVLSTLHTNSAPETITRLLDMGLDPFAFADALLAILAQRLTRRLCDECKRTLGEPAATLQELKDAYGLREEFDRMAAEHHLATPVGCEACNRIGYRRRLAIHELLSADDVIREMILHKATVSEIRNHAIQEGMRTLRQDGIAKVLQGKTTLDEVFQVCTR